MAATRDRMGGDGMSNRRHVAKPVQPAPVTRSEAAEIVQPVVSDDAAASIPIYRRCPICWDRCKGVGTVYTTNGSTRYYKCKRTLTEQPPCGHTWTAIVRTEVIKVESRTVTLTER